MKKFKVKVLAFLASMLFRSLGPCIHIKPVNYPEVDQFIVGTWHAYQCVFYNIKNPEHLNVLISQSNDGEIVSKATEAMGIRVVRGSKGRKGAQATLQLIEKLEQGENIAITVDGPRGPARVVKPGIINIAKITQVPIIPVVWYSTSKLLLKFNSWDNLRFPLYGLKSVALYGEPIYIPQDCDDEQIEYYRKKLEDTLTALDVDIHENYDEYIKSKA